MPLCAAMLKTYGTSAQCTVFCDHCRVGRNLSLTTLDYLEKRGLAFVPLRDLLLAGKLTCQTCHQPAVTISARLTGVVDWVERWTVVDGKLIQTPPWTPPDRRHGASPR